MNFCAMTALLSWSDVETLPYGAELGRVPMGVVAIPAGPRLRRMASPARKLNWTAVAMTVRMMKLSRVSVILLDDGQNDGAG